jgi:two-component system chemotaxis sensor kinase CheA
VVVVRRNPLSLVRLHRLFEIEPDTTDPCRGLVVIVEHEGRQMALMVDELLGQQQVVVKSLEDNYRKVAGYMGATILGDGRASLILDVGGVIDRWRSASAVAA